MLPYVLCCLRTYGLRMETNSVSKFGFIYFIVVFNPSVRDKKKIIIKKKMEKINGKNNFRTLNFEFELVVKKCLF